MKNKAVSTFCGSSPVIYRLENEAEFTGVGKEAQRAMPPKNFSISGHFVLWEPISQTKYCWSPQI